MRSPAVKPDQQLAQSNSLNQRGDSHLELFTKRMAGSERCAGGVCELAAFSSPRVCIPAKRLDVRLISCAKRQGNPGPLRLEVIIGKGAIKNRLRDDALWQRNVGGR